MMQAEETYEVGDTIRLTYGLEDADGVPVPLDEVTLVVHRGGTLYDTFTEFEDLEDQRKGFTYVVEEPGFYAFEWQARGQVSDTTPAFDGKLIRVKEALARA